MPPLLLITAVIINSNYDEAFALNKCWTPGSTLTIVLRSHILQTPLQTFQLLITFGRYCTDSKNREDVDRTGRPEREGGGGYCYEVEISGSVSLENSSLELGILLRTLRVKELLNSSNSSCFCSL